MVINIPLGYIFTQLNKKNGLTLFRPDRYKHLFKKD